MVKVRAPSGEMQDRMACGCSRPGQTDRCTQPKDEGAAGKGETDVHGTPTTSVAPGEGYSAIVARGGLVMDRARLRGPHCVEDCHDGQGENTEDCYDLCYDNVSNEGAIRQFEGRSKILYGDLEYDEKMRQRYFSGSQCANVTDFSNVY